MKRIIVCFFILSAPLWALAQKGLHVERVFDGGLIPRNRIEETMVRGAALKEYKLELYRGMKMEVDSVERQHIETLVMNDGKGMMDREDGAEYEMQNGHLTYCILSLPAIRHKRYLCYQCYKSRPDAFTVTLVYLEGKATLRDLRKTFRKK